MVSGGRLKGKGRENGLLEVSFFVRKRRLGLSLESVPRQETASGHRRNGDVPVVGHPPRGFTRSAVTHTGVTATKALQLAEDRPF